MAKIGNQTPIRPAKRYKVDGFAAYDRLPAVVRLALQEACMNYSAGQALATLSNLSPEALAKAIYETDLRHISGLAPDLETILPIVPPLRANWSTSRPIGPQDLGL